MIRVNIYDAKTHLSSHLKRLEEGETILLCRRNVPVAEIRPLPARPTEERPVGLARKRFSVPACFFAPLPEDAVSGFEGGGG